MKKIKEKLKNNKTFMFFYKKTKSLPKTINTKFAEFLFLAKPKTKKEKKLIKELRNNTQQILNKEKQVSTNFWSKQKKELFRNILKKDPRNFLRWDIIQNTMFHECKPAELEYLKSVPSWNIWKKALKESMVGNPKKYRFMKESSGNLIHHGYSLAQAINNFNLNTKNQNVIFEFGGGYGSMCRLSYQLGFKGQYIIFDLPEFSNIQEYYLKSLNLDLNISKTPTQNKEKTVILLSDIDELKKQLAYSNHTDILIATWSLSETPIELRNKILETVGSVKYYLIAYQEKFESMDNIKYFKQLTKNKIDTSWINIPINHIKGSHYLIGKQNEKKNNNFRT